MEKWPPFNAARNVASTSGGDDGGSDVLDVQKLAGGGGRG